MNGINLLALFFVFCAALGLAAVLWWLYFTEV